ncbi:MAG: hypothetical protein JNK04_15385 [Myxococcales bacterium]|nr:hypothetical protein [Myxococcales bacterium]
MDVTPPVFVYLANGNELCPDGLFRAEPATRRVVNGAAESFYCVPPNGADDLNVNDQPWCRDVLANHSAVDECGADSDGACDGDKCLTDACVTSHGAIVSLCGQDLASVGTSNELAASAAVAQEKIIERAASYHQADVPGNANADPNDPNEPLPGRYCFVTCFDESLYTDPVACDPADDPWVNNTSTLVAIEPGSEATITVSTTDENGDPQTTEYALDIEGSVAIDVPRECRGLDHGESAVCNAGIGSILLRGQSDITVNGLTISDLDVINRANWTASAVAAGDTTTVSLDSAPALVTADVAALGRFGLRRELAGVSGVLDWDARTYETSTSFRDPSGSGDSTTITFTGTIPNMPPRADAGPDVSVECSGDGQAVVTLPGRGTDPDGDEDIASFAWSRQAGGGWIVSPSGTLHTAFELGETQLILTATDAAGAQDMDGLRVTVLDTRAPVIEDIEVAPGTLWPADSRLRLFRIGQEIRPTVGDACDSDPIATIADVSGDGDIRYNDGAICIRAASGPSNPLRSYTVTIEATDASGNWTQEDVVITNADFATVVADNDPRCP